MSDVHLDDASVVRIADFLAARVQPHIPSPPEPPSIWRSGGLAIDLLKLVVAALLAYGVINSRVAVLESRMESVQGDMTDIKRALQTIVIQNTHPQPSISERGDR